MPRRIHVRHGAPRVLSLLFVLGLISLTQVPGALYLFRPTVYAATTFTVNSTGDGADSNLADGLCDDGTGHCTLRAAIQQANATAGADTINFSVTGTINLMGALPDVTTDMTINGPGASLLTVRRNTGGNYRVFTIQSGATVTISGLTASNGRTPDGVGDSTNGGGVFNAGTLNLTEVTVSGNLTGDGASTDPSVSPWRGGDGGGIANTGAITLKGVTVSGNKTGTSTHFSVAGGRPSGGDGAGLFNSGTMTLTNSTVSGNQTGIGIINGAPTGDAGQGSGIANIGTLTVINSTVTANDAGGNSTAANEGPGLTCSQHNIFFGTAAIGNSIIAHNTGRNDIEGPINSLGHNIIKVYTASDPNIHLTSTDITGQDPRLGPLADNGGPTQTHALLAGSPAIDAGDNSLAVDANNSPLTTDQRGAGFPRISRSAVDIGAFESQAFVVNSTGDTDDGSCAAAGVGNGCTLREAVNAANSLSAAVISFDPSMTAGGAATISLMSPLPYIRSNVTISGPGPNLLTLTRSSNAVDVNDFSLVIIYTGPTVSLSGLTLTGGQRQAGGGGGVNNLGTLTINDCVITGNNAHAGGGIENSNFGTLTIYNSTISNNVTDDFGGGINNAGVLTVVNSTISGNRTDLSGGGIRTGGPGSSLTVINSTITNNRADYDDDFVGGGGGIDTFQCVTTLKNTIVAGNFRHQGSPVRDDVNGHVNSTCSFNLIGDGTGLDGLSGGSNSNLIGTSTAPIDALLGPLADGGGHSKVHVPLPGSPAISAGDNSLAVDANSNPLTTDQRGAGFPRVVNTTVDIGAVEVSYAISATAGTPQSASINAAFATLLKATVTESGNARSGIPVTFTAPASGAGGMFGGTAAVTVNTDSNGVATAPAFNANATVGGPYNVVASVTGGAPTANFALTNTKGSQTITFGSLAGRTFGDVDFQLSATASSGLPVSFSPSGNCTVSGSTVHITGAGSCTITATQGGDGNYNPAPDVQQTFQVAKADQTITVTSHAPPSAALNSTFTVAALSNSGLPISYSSSGACTNNGTTFTMTAASGTCKVMYDQAGNGNFNAAAQASESVTARKADQTVSFGTLSNKTFGDPDFQLSAAASSGLAVSFAATGNCALSGGSVHITGAGSCTVTASQSGDSSYNPAPDVQHSFTINKASSATSVTVAGATFNGQSHGGSASATGAGGLNQSLTVTYTGRNTTIYNSTTAPTSAGDYTASASFGGDANHTGSSDSKDFQITKASQTITFGALKDRVFGDTPFTISATGGASSSPVTFSAIGDCASGGTDGSTITITGAGSCTVTASQAGDTNYNAAANVQQSFQIAKASTSTALSSSSSPSLVGNSVTFTAAVTSTAGTPTGTVTFEDGGTAITSCSNIALSSGQAACTTSALSFGAHTITADYSGDSNFSASSATLSGGQAVAGGFEFSQDTFTVGERDGSVTITVRRTGDTSQAASVDYSTDDGSIPSVAVPCSAVTGLALERCDYTRAAGTLRFAAGDTQKTFAVLVNDDSYAEGAEVTHLRLSNAVGAQLAQQSSATLQITDDAQQTVNPVDGPSYFVRQHYRDFLNREPDTPGLQFWTNNIGSCGADSQCREVKRVDTSAAFFLSIEFQQTGYLVERMYKTSFGDATGNSTLGGAHQLGVPIIRLDEFLRDTQEVGSTPNKIVVGQGNWQQQLEANKQAFALEFVSRQQFATAFPSSMTADAFVNQLDANAGGVLTANDIAQLDNTFGGPSASSNDAAKRAQVLRQVAENATLQQRESDRAFVLMQFFGYLRRNPNDAPDADYTGYDFWLQKLDQFNGDYVQAEMVKAFISSDEYRHRFGQ